jgi:hypothetical protein
MGGVKIGVIKEPIMIRWRDNELRENSSEWGYVGMPVIIKDISQHHYNIEDLYGVLNPMFANKKLINEVEIEWKQIR